MSARSGEAFVLQTWPFRESDLIVSFLTRDSGKLRGVAYRARRPKNGFGSGLERLSHVRMSYRQRENRELVNIDSCELLDSQFGVLSDFQSACALDFLAEVSEQLLPPAEPFDRHFRLLNAVLERLRSGGPDDLWRAVTYFSFWSVKLAGLMPPLDVCLGCGSGIGAGEKVFFMRHSPGVYCPECRGTLNLRNAWELESEARAIAREMERVPVGELPARTWTQSTAAGLRRFLAQQMEAHTERKLVTWSVLEAA